MKTTTLTLALALSFLTLTGIAEAKPAIYKVATYQTWAVAFPDGEATPLDVGHGFGLGRVDMFEGWSWFTELGFTVAPGPLHPAPKVVIGPGIKLSERLALGLTIAYQLKPAYSGQKRGHLVGATIAPTLKISDTTSLALVVGGGKLIDGPWSAVMMPKVSLTLP